MRNSDVAHVNLGGGVSAVIDLGSKSNMAVETILKKQSNGSYKIISCSLIGRANNLDTKEKEINILKER